MRYATVCSGIEAPTVAWRHLGWKCQFMAEIDKFPRAVLQHHYPDVKLFGDFRTINPAEWKGKVDLLIAGTPCQSFSTAGARGGLDDERGQLTIEFARLVRAIRPRWFILENVPGLLFQSDGADFSTVISAFTGHDGIAGGQFPWKNSGIFPGNPKTDGYGLSWRILDAGFFGIAHDRRRVIIVGHHRTWRSAAGVQYVGEGGGGHRSKRERTPLPIAKNIETGTAETGEPKVYDCNPQDHRVVGPLAKIGAFPSYAGRGGCNLPIVFTRDQKGTFHSTENKGNLNSIMSQNKNGPPIVYEKRSKKHKAAGGGNQPIVAFDAQVSGTAAKIPCSNNKVPNMVSSRIPALLKNSIIRWFMPTEAEAAFGFPKNYTQIPYRGKPAEKCPKGPRYKAIGNSMVTPVIEWIGDRIAAVEAEIINQENQNGKANTDRMV